MSPGERDGSDCQVSWAGVVILLLPELCGAEGDGSCGHLVAVILESRACGQVATRQLLAQVPATAEWGKV